jgi:ankyrin repeat protein
MPVQVLPENPSLENLRKRAKQLRKTIREGDPKALAPALAHVREFHPKPDEALASLTLHDAQLVVARSYGFASWTKLKQHLAVVDRFVWNPPAEQTADDTPADRFVRRACLVYGDWHPSRAVKARAMLAEQPELAGASIYTASAAGDAGAVRAWLARDPKLANAKGGALGWEPLLYASYSRLDGDATLEAARVLIAAGADPNAGFLWCGNVPPFTALTGAFGKGEDGNNMPPHPRCEALARLLLDAGADPNDGQTLYNCHFERNDDHLKLLLSYGLGQDKNGPWFERLGDKIQRPARMLVEELWAAARKNYRARVELLVTHGAEVNTPGVRDGRTPYEAALMTGNHEIAKYLLEHSAKRIELDPIETFTAACMAGDREKALALLAADPALPEKLGRHGFVELAHRAVEANHPEAVRLIASLGFGLNGTASMAGLDRTPLHNAAWNGNLEMVQLLIELGADVHATDPSYHSTPLGWAHHNQQAHVVAYLMPFATIFEALSTDGVERVAELLDGDPSLANAKDVHGDPLVFSLHRGLRRFDELVELLRGHGADFHVRNRKGRTVVEAAQEQGDDFVAALRRQGFR